MLSPILPMGMQSDSEYSTYPGTQGVLHVPVHQDPPE